MLGRMGKRRRGGQRMGEIVWKASRKAGRQETTAMNSGYRGPESPFCLHTAG